jgi:hypothetical protein
MSQVHRKKYAFAFLVYFTQWDKLHIYSLRWCVSNLNVMTQMVLRDEDDRQPMPVSLQKLMCCKNSCTCFLVVLHSQTHTLRCTRRACESRQHGAPASVHVG